MWVLKGNLFHRKILISLENSNSRDVRESVEKLQHCQKTPALVTIFCQKSPISSEKSDIVEKLWYCQKTQISSENSDIVGKLRYCQKTPIFMMNISILNGGKLVRHPYSLVLRHSTYLYVGIGRWNFYQWVKGTPRYEGFKKALSTVFSSIWNHMPIPNCQHLYAAQFEINLYWQNWKNMNFLGLTKRFQMVPVLIANADNLKSPGLHLK